MYCRLVRPLRLVVVAAGLLACESTIAPVPVFEHHVTAEMVTGAALAALDTDGRFRFDQPVAGPGQLSINDAKTQTLQFARYVTNNVLMRGAVEEGRGGYWTDPHLLTLCRNVHYVHSQLGSVVTDSVSASITHIFQRRYGAQWLIPMCGSNDDPQMVVQAALDGNDIRFANNAPIEPYTSLTTAWFARGVPLNWPDPLTLSAERAVRFVWQTFGVRVAEVPQLFFRGDILNGSYVWHQIGSARSCNRWRIVLESDVAIRGMTSLSRSTVNVIHVGPLSCSSLDVTPYIHLPQAEQPTTVLLQEVDDSINPPKPWIVQVPVVAPIRFEIATRAP